MSFLQKVQDPMCLNNLSCNITDKMYMYNCISTNMLDLIQLTIIILVDQDHVHEHVRRSQLTYILHPSCSFTTPNVIHCGIISHFEVKYYILW